MHLSKVTHPFLTLTEKLKNTNRNLDKILSLLFYVGDQTIGLVAVQLLIFTPSIIKIACRYVYVCQNRKVY